MTGFRKPPKPTTAEEFINQSATHTRGATAPAGELTRTTIQLPVALLRAAKLRAVENGETVSDVVRRALESYARA